MLSCCVVVLWHLAEWMGEMRDSAGEWSEHGGTKATFPPLVNVQILKTLEYHCLVITIIIIISISTEHNLIFAKFQFQVFADG